MHYEWEPRDAPVLPHGGAGEWDSHDALNPSVVRRGAAYYNFYSGFDGNDLAHDPGDFRRRPRRGRKKAWCWLPSRAPGKADYIAANGSALFDEGEFRYWYQAGPKEAPRLGLARSSDGRHWRKARFPVMDYGPRGSWDERGLADPYVLKVGGYFYLFYLGRIVRGGSAGGGPIAGRRSLAEAAVQPDSGSSASTAASTRWAWASRPCGSRMATTGCCIPAATRARIGGWEWRDPPMAFTGKTAGGI